MSETTIAGVLAQKSEEYANHPGMVLGLDGWVLRALPQDQREFFLRGYEKLLRIAYHPDRAQSEEGRISRDRYLQHISEAVNFMLTDEYAYEMSTEAVPTRRNPVLQMREMLTLHEQGSAKALEQLEICQNELRQWRTKAEAATLAILQANNDNKRMQDRTNRLLQYQAQGCARYAMPIHTPIMQLMGTFLEFRQRDAIMREWAIACASEQLYFFSQWQKLSEWKTPNGLGPIRKATVRKGRLKISEDEPVYKVIGSSSPFHLAEYCRQVFDLPKEPPSLDNLAAAIAQITAGSRAALAGLGFYPFLMSFIWEGVLLLLEGPNGLRWYAVDRIIGGRSAAQRMLTLQRQEANQAMDRTCKRYDERVAALRARIAKFREVCKWRIERRRQVQEEQRVKKLDAQLRYHQLAEKYQQLKREVETDRKVQK